MGSRNSDAKDVKVQRRDEASVSAYSAMIRTIDMIHRAVRIFLMTSFRDKVG